ncbi:MAG: hypothetical protein NTY15_01765 [Planctomycetota bacterium]|nr:hypothetical protein [Planctomycetota bacterium]
MKWYSYSIVHPIEYEYCPSGGVRARKTQGNWNVMFKDLGKDEDCIRGYQMTLLRSSSQCSSFPLYLDLDLTAATLIDTVVFEVG